MKTPAMKMLYILVDEDGAVNLCTSEQRARGLIKHEENAKVFAVDQALLESFGQLAPDPIFGVVDGEPWG